ncbi:MAG TPA: hypothetical protein VF517_11440 [Thermoleophilaceae bacterium]|jgi:hypothetical protein
MGRWPPIHDPQALRWISLDDETWLAELEKRVRAFGSRAYDAAALEHALGYPWERPSGSYVLRGGQVSLIEDIEPAERRAAVAEHARDRYPLVAFGANGAPSRLQDRFASFEDPRDRDALVLTGELHGVDVGAQASPTAFGSMPGVLFASPGTAVRAAVLWLTPAQLGELTKAELGYRLGRLDRARFTMDEAGVSVDDVFAYVSRIGTLRLDGEPVALGAVPARGRSARAMTQEQLLEAVGTLALGRPVGAADVVRMCFEDMAALMSKLIPLTWPTALRLPDDEWSPYPVDDGVGTRPPG